MNNYRFIITLVFLLISTTIYAQQTEDACKYMTNASASYCDGNYKKAIKFLKKLLKNYPEHTLADEAQYAIANSYDKLNKTAKAELAYLALLKKENTSVIDSFGYDLFNCNFMQAECRNILIPESLTSIQHECCLNLANIYFEKTDIKSAFNYVKKADKKYRDWFGCGTGDYEEDMRLSQYYSRYYQGVNNADSALKVVLPFVFEPAAFPNMQYDNIIKQTYTLLLNKYEKDELKIQLDKAIDQVIQENLGNDHHSSYRYYVLFEGVYIPASPMYLFEHNASKSDVIEFIKSTTFYQKIAN